MTLVVSFDNSTPPPRFHPIVTPWNRARVEEAPAAAGPWTALEVIALEAPLDEDLANPQPRDLSTTLGTAPRQWYRIVWLDADDRESSPTDPVLNDPVEAPEVGLLATVEELKRYLRTVGTVSAGAGLDEDLLGDLLAAASARIIAALPERTLIPDLPGDDPVEVRIPYTGGRIVQVPDLRELVTYNGTLIADNPLGPTLMRRPRELCALWLQFGGGWTIPPYPGGELVLVGRWGPAAARLGDPIEVNPAVREAALVWAARAYHNRTARYADTVQSPEGGVASYFRNLPPDVKATVDALTIPGL
jgi:hypothetical protein